MRLSIACTAAALLACAAAAAQESFPATHIVRLDILEPNPDAGTIGGVAIVAYGPSSGIAQIRVTAAPRGDMPDSLFLLYRPSAGKDVVLASAAFLVTSPTLTIAVPLFTPTVLSTIDSGRVWLAVHKRSDHTPYVEGPVVSVLSAGTPESSGDQVVPPVQTDGVANCGLTYDPVGNVFRYSAWWLDLGGPATAARIRRGAVGSTGPIVLEMPLTPGSDESIGIWENPNSELRSAMVDGELYFEVTTATFPNGEIRGQIYPVEGFTAAIEPGNEVPPVDGATASGSAYLLITAHGTGEVFNKLQGVIGNLSGPITAAHIHRGAVGQGGDPAVTLEHSTESTIDLELASGSAGGAMSDEIVNEIRATRSYVNVHTPMNQNGEARGQLIPARTRLVTSAPGAVTETRATAAGFSARYDRDGRRIIVTTGDGSGTGRVALYAADGNLARMATYEGSRCEISSDGLPAGIYFVRVVGAGGACSVVVMP